MQAKVLPNINMEEDKSGEMSLFKRDITLFSVVWFSNVS